MKTFIHCLRAAMLGGLILAQPAMGVEMRWVYYWTDARGIDHFSDIPVDGARKIRVPAKVPFNATAEEAARAALSQGSDVAASGKQGPEECAQKRAMLRQYESHDVQIVETDSLGNDRFYDANERAKLIEQTRSQIDRTCGV